MSKRIDLTGQRFGAWTVVRFGAQRPTGQTTWLCRCDCGVEREVVAQTLRMGLTSSCGCMKGAAIAKAKRTHGGSYKASYAVWKDMIRRCTVKSAPNYKNYGGRGIQVCERWQDYLNFVADMGEPPKGLSIERKDNDGNYEKDNCIWATRTEQNSNRRYAITPRVRDENGKFAPGTQDDAFTQAMELARQAMELGRVDLAVDILEVHATVFACPHQRRVSAPADR